MLSRLGILGMHTDEVVGVHDGMNEGVQENGEEYITVVLEIDVKPAYEDDGCVVVYVQEGQLPPFLSNDHEDCVPQIENFANVKQPEYVGHGRVIGHVYIAV